MLRLISTVIILVMASPVWAAPAISESTPTTGWSHGSSITITGTGFGTKSTAAPTIWDDCSGTDPLDLWDTVYNYDSGDDYKGAYRTPAQVGRGVDTLSWRDKYYSGCHYPGGTYSGNNVGVIKELSNLSAPFSVYVSWYERADPNWNWDANLADNNYKLFWHRVVGNEYAGQYYELNHEAPPDRSLRATNFYSGTAFYSSVYVNMLSKFYHFEIEYRVASDGSGHLKTWVDGALAVNATGQSFIGDTDPNSHWLVVGYYARDHATTNWRYYHDIYLDLSFQRVIIGNASTLAGCTTFKELQLPTAWSDTSITVTVNEGAAPDGTAYLYVFDATGDANSTGYEITIGGSSPSTRSLNRVNLNRVDMH